MPLANVSHDDRYVLESGRIYLSGVQALARLPIMQRRRDVAAGLNTAGFISGYRGSPLGGLDQNLWKARKHLDAHHVRFQPGLNEDLGATAVWGSQQLNLFPGAQYDGVFAMWYGKGPGVDRTGDVFKHANFAGSSRYGGVLVVAGDDHACKSSTLPHQSEYAFMDAHIPVLNPAGVDEILDFGLIGWALSRYSGLWVGMKTIAETVDSSASVTVDPTRIVIAEPEDFDLPAGGLSIRWPDKPLDQEMRLQKYKLYAALAFARANRLDRLVMDAPEARLGILTTGKSYLDVRQALEDLGIDARRAAEIGLRLYKVGLSWPLEREGVRRFAEGLEEILVVEEKRAVLENQLKEQLYNWREDVRPRVIGKFDESEEWILPSTAELTPARIARVIAKRVARVHESPEIERRLRFLVEKERSLAKPRRLIERTPHFCSGCPHNTSTRLPEGSRALAGIGCHYMVTWMDRSTATFTQMGGEGVPWIGQAPFTDERHVFANLGDGTYFHSGLLAIRAALAAGVNITYKLLYNDAVAMTGGQPVDGTLTVDRITRQLAAEGVKRIVVVSDEPQKYPRDMDFAPGTTVHPRVELEHLQRELREEPGCSVLVYDQTCAAEKRRRRKRGKLADPAKRAFINAAVCEGCGDCGDASNCLSVVPLETPLGRKRAIDQSACNKDFSCVDGFCPSFVTVYGAEPRKPKPASAEEFAEIPEPSLPSSATPYGILVTGIGGTGVVTIGALLGAAAHLEGKGVSVLDQTGLAQKYGAVTSHIRIADDPAKLHAVRIAAGGTNLLLACDLVVAASAEVLGKLDAERSHAVINRHEQMPAAFTHAPDLAFPGEDMVRTIAESVVASHTLEATDLATRLMGDAIAANLFMIGFAYQKALVPVSSEAIECAIEFNGVSVDANKQAFLWGRRAAHDLEAVQALARPSIEPSPERFPNTLDELIEHRKAHLTAYQNAKLAKRYADLVERVRSAEQRVSPELQGLAEAVAHNYARLLAYKDEYEVARLYTDGRFQQALEKQFEGEYTLKLHLAPPILAKRDPTTGRPRKRQFGPWILKAMGPLARLKILRGTALDPFSRNPERVTERALIHDYERTMDALLGALTEENHRTAIEIARIPETIRGFGHVKAENLERAKDRERRLLSVLLRPGAGPPCADAA